MFIILLVVTFVVAVALATSKKPNPLLQLTAGSAVFMNVAGFAPGFGWSDVFRQTSAISASRESKATWARATDN